MKPINTPSLRAEQRQGFWGKYYPRYEGGDFSQNRRLGLAVRKRENIFVFGFILLIDSLRKLGWVDSWIERLSKLGGGESSSLKQKGDARAEARSSCTYTTLPI